VECTVDNAFNLRDFVLQDLVKIIESFINLHSTLSKDQPEDGPTNWAETCRWNYNLI